ncbi:hypothetical protein LGH70_02825 [Hymenobacter sp. BT635]|uniref:Photosynthesis system II assembly factor Ycf48/Hcf136-like domain-containing protein n=1 Tax=Hymenobacter nitidus TaxID=2880929 RepID=A0ABS8A9U3_9BACT|nr:hypothetical protein [Hymenobacter nitidus]MCB2376497.1 hypothetical protein [Hymenobacter nitidus]
MANEHRNLRARVPLLLLLGTLLLLPLLWGWLTRPTRSLLTGYQFRQVGVRADSTRWILAHQNAKAVLLFNPADTSQGWQRRELGVAAAGAQHLALDWGGKALLVGSNGAVQVYDSLLQPIPALDTTLTSWPRQMRPKMPQLPKQPGPLPAQLVVADPTGNCAVIVGMHGEVYATGDGGRFWNRWNYPGASARSDTDTVRAAVYAGLQPYINTSWTSSVEPNSRFPSFYLATAQGYYTLYLYQGYLDSEVRISAPGESFTQWKAALPATVAWCGIAAKNNLLAIDRRGNWASIDTAGTDEGAGEFFRRTVSVMPLDSNGNFLGVGSEELFQHRVVGFTTSKKQRVSIGAPQPARIPKPTAAARKATSRASAKQTKTTTPVRNPTKKASATKKTPRPPLEVIYTQPQEPAPKQQEQPVPAKQSDYPVYQQQQQTNKEPSPKPGQDKPRPQ